MEKEIKLIGTFRFLLRNELNEIRWSEMMWWCWVAEWHGKRQCDMAGRRLKTKNINQGISMRNGKWVERDVTQIVNSTNINTAASGGLEEWENAGICSRPMGAVWNLESNEIQLHLLNLAHEGEGGRGSSRTRRKGKGLSPTSRAAQHISKKT